MIEKPKVGDWVIAWDYDRIESRVGILTHIDANIVCTEFKIDNLNWYKSIVKWDGTKEHIERVRKGEI